MSSSSSSSSPSSSSHQQPSSSIITPSNVVDIPGPSNTNNNDDEFEAPSSSRQRAMNEVWLEPVVEALATQVAIDSSHYHGRLSAASALAIIFQISFGFEML
ncbi:hypothetical protein TSUD_254170 [Trifolium subterraneum]|uniref:Uncharacterized protein n=1 Tax=Trifolium subterraneum TaxID=3900 RepID=A0A2Z6NGH5_TRISU|nr:hypothetical protein TSUD_254170 [Trifolium subterraneum]